MNTNWFFLNERKDIKVIITYFTAFLEVENPDRYELVPTINECNELFAYFATKCLESLTKCTRLSLDILRKRASVSRWLKNSNNYVFYTYIKSASYGYILYLDEALFFVRLIYFVYETRLDDSVARTVGARLEILGSILGKTNKWNNVF